MDVHHPTVVLQFGLGHWDRSLVPGPAAGEHRRQFLNVADWAAASMDESGGWSVFPQLGIKTESPYSAMTQGLAISVLVRAWAATGSRAYLDQARMAARLMVEPIETGGTSRVGPAGIVLEEGPLVPPNTVLNGWLFGLFGLHDLLLVRDSADPDLESALADTVAALVRGLSAFDAGWWSRYDTAGHLASPFYHRLHIAQLAALERTFPTAAEPVSAVRIRWQRSLKSPIQRTRAIVRKAAQQLSDPPVRIE